MNTDHLEEEIAHLRRATDDLSAQVAQQQEEIARLSRQITLLLRRAAEAEADATGGHIFGDEQPPHY